MAAATAMPAYMGSNQESHQTDAVSMLLCHRQPDDADIARSAHSLAGYLE